MDRDTTGEQRHNKETATDKSISALQQSTHVLQLSRAPGEQLAVAHCIYIHATLAAERERERKKESYREEFEEERRLQQQQLERPYEGKERNSSGTVVRTRRSTAENPCCAERERERDNDTHR